MTINSLPDLSSHSSSPQQFSATSIKAKWLAVQASVTVLIGDSSISNGSPQKGFTLQPGQVFEFPQDESCLTAQYDLSQLYVILTSGTLSVIYGT